MGSFQYLDSKLAEIHKVLFYNFFLEVNSCDLILLSRKSIDGNAIPWRINLLTTIEPCFVAFFDQSNLNVLSSVFYTTLDIQLHLYKYEIEVL